MTPPSYVGGGRAAPPRLLRVTTVPLSLQTLLVGQLSYMQRAGFEVIAVSSPGPMLDDLIRDGVKTYGVHMLRRLSPALDARAVFELVRIFRRERPDIVHSHTPKAGLLAMAAARVAGVPARVHTYAGAPYDGVGGIAMALAKTADRVTARLATHVWAVGHELQQFLENERVVERGRIEVIGRGSSNGVDLAIFTPAPRIRPAMPPRFIWIGRLSEDKGVAELAALWNVIESQLKGATLRIVGGVDERTPPRSADTNRMLRRDSIEFLGFRQDVAECLREADVLLFTSRREGLPGVVLQAQAAGVPVIALLCRGLGDALVEGVGGRIFDRRRIADAAAAAVHLARDETVWRHHREAGRRFVQERFDQRVVHESLLSRYRDLLEHEATDATLRQEV